MKRVIAVLFALSIALSLSSFAYAQEIAPTGKSVFVYGDWSYEVINSNEYKIEGTTSTDSDITLPNSFLNRDVVSLGNHVFVNSETLLRVIAPAPLNTICEYAFLDAKVLQTVTLPPTLTTIETGAFSGTSALFNINLEDTGITSVPAYCFMDSALSSVELPNTCKTIGIYAFAQCYALEKIVIPDNVTEIADTAFESDENLVIYCNTESYAHQYAEAKGIEYVLIDAPFDVSYMVGDADGDGKITILDATKIQRLLAALVDDADGMIALRGDSDGSGLDILDATKIQRFLAGFTTQENIGSYQTSTIIPS